MRKNFDAERTQTYCMLSYGADPVGTLSCTPGFENGKQNISRKAYVWFLKMSDREYRFATNAKELEALAVLHGIETIRVAK